MGWSYRSLLGSNWAATNSGLTRPCCAGSGAPIPRNPRRTGVLAYYCVSEMHMHGATAVTWLPTGRLASSPPPQPHRAATRAIRRHFGCCQRAPNHGPEHHPRPSRDALGIWGWAAARVQPPAPRRAWPLDTRTNRAFCPKRRKNRHDRSPAGVPLRCCLASVLLARARALNPGRTREYATTVRSCAGQAARSVPAANYLQQLSPLHGRPHLI